MSAKADVNGAEAEFKDTEASTGAAPEEVTEASIPEGKETGASADELILGTVAEDLYQTGLDLGLTPSEAALLVSEMALPYTYQR